MHIMDFRAMDFGPVVWPESRGARPKSMVRMDIGPVSVGPMSMCMLFIQVIARQNRRCRGSWGTWGTSAPYKAFGMLKGKNRGRGGRKKEGRVLGSL